MRNLRHLAVAVVVALCVVVAGWVYVQRSLGRAVGGFSGIAELAVSRLGRLAYPAARTARSEEGRASFVETLVYARRVGEAALSKAGALALPANSGALASLKPRERVDGWGHTFCILAAGTYLAVVSPGPQGAAFTDCGHTGLKPSDLVGLGPGRLHSLPSGLVVLLVDRQHTGRARGRPEA